MTFLGSPTSIIQSQAVIRCQLTAGGTVEVPGMFIYFFTMWLTADLSCAGIYWEQTQSWTSEIVHGFLVDCLLVVYFVIVSNQPKTSTQK